MKQTIKEIGISLIFPMMMIAAMYLAKLCEIIFAKVPIEIMIIIVTILIYKIIKTALKLENR